MSFPSSPPKKRVRPEEYILPSAPARFRTSDEGALFGNKVSSCTSPLPSDTKVNHYNTVAPLLLFSQKQAQPPKIEEIYDISPLDVDRKELIECLEALERKISLFQIGKVRDAIKHFLSEKLSDDKVITWTGILLFFVARDHSLPEDLSISLIDKRIIEIQNEAITINKEHGINIIPSGYMLYLLNTFACTLVLPNGHGINPGGGKAVIAYLNSPYIKSFFTNETQREKILALASRFASQPLLHNKKDLYPHLYHQVRDALKTWTVHPLMDSTLRAAIGLPASKSVTRETAVWVILTALMSDLRQLPRGNCYAIANVNYHCRAHPEAVFAQMGIWIKEGCFELFDGEQSPILPPLTSQPVIVKSTEIKTPLPRGRSTPSRLLVRTMRVVGSSFLNLSPHCSTIHHLFPADKQPLAQQTLEASIRHPMLTLMSTLIMFRRHNKVSDPSSIRENFLKVIIQECHPYITDKEEQALTKKLREELWIVPQLLDLQKTPTGKWQAHTGPYSFIFSSDASASQLKNFLNNAMAIFFKTKEGKLYPTYTLTSFSKHLRETLGSIKQKGSRKDSLLQYLDSCAFNTAILFAMRSENMPITAEQQQASNLMLFTESGGHVAYAPIKHVPLTHRRELDIKSIHNWVEILTKHLVIIKKELPNLPIIAIGSGDHDFTLPLSSCQLPTEEGAPSFSSWIQKTFVDKREAILATVISSDTIEKLLQRYSNHFFKSFDLSSKIIANGSLTMGEMITQLIKHLKEDELVEAKTLLNKEVYYVTDKKLDYPKLAHALGVDLATIQDYLHKHTPFKENPYLSPCSLANSLVTYLETNGKGVFDRRKVAHKIENQAHLLPLAYVADWNSTSNYAENPIPNRLVLTSDLFSGDLTLLIFDENHLYPIHGKNAFGKLEVYFSGKSSIFDLKK